MDQETCEIVDPRIRRTRQLLLQALEKLLATKEFDKISVQDIADAATVNRATFYDHYGDKFALLQCMVGSRFHELLAEREVRFDGACSAALRAIVLAVCDYLTGMRRLEPHMESAVIAVVRRILLEGIERHPPETGTPEVVAATASWAIYGAAREWAQSAERCPPEEMAGTITALVSRLLLPNQQLG
jgi:AcrR family transcriptional regulator